MEGMFSLLRTFLFMRMQHMHGDLTQPRWAAQASRTCKRPGWENGMLETAAELSLKLLSNHDSRSFNICDDMPILGRFG